jgi:hypothetical protein
MPLDWSAYDGFDWANARQFPLAEQGWRDVEEFVAGLLHLPEDTRHTIWGSASPPGRYAATVVRIAPEAAHAFAERAAARGIAQIGVKVFKTTPDAWREGRSLVEFHNHRLPRLPGLPHPRVQRSLEAGIHRQGGQERLYVVQEWIAGASLEDLLRRVWPREPLSGSQARALIEELLGGIVLPLWSVGTVWWDVRDANFCYDRECEHLVMIDVDSLAAFADEILDTPTLWTRRSKGRSTALARLRQMTIRLTLAQGLRPRSRVEQTVTRAWNEVLEPALLRLGQGSDEERAARLALASFVPRCPGLEE